MLATVAEAQAERWGSIEELLAAILEVLDRNGLWFFQVNTPNDTPTPDPIEINRPGEASTNGSRPATPAQVKAFFGSAVHYTP